ncbi:MAG: outer membrane beta-barrel domain-containing protein [Myxococcaceae bacterium]|nr:outer membrane beta-barrel domain-containing protein [Myxococcaceae bacterium]
MHRAILIVCLLVPVFAWGQSELLEAPPSSVNALQDRAYRLQNEFTVMVGFLPSDPYTKGLFAQGGYAFHFNDYFGIQARGAYAVSLPTSLRNQLERDFTVLPTAFSRVLFFVGGDLIFRPLYGKLSVGNRFVVHGEVHLLGGGSGFAFTDGLTPSIRPAIDIGGGGRLFLGKNASLRLDLVNHIVLAAPGSMTGITNVLALNFGLAVNFGGTE